MLPHWFQPYFDLGLPLFFLLAFAMDPRAGTDGRPPAWWRSPLLWLGGGCLGLWLYRLAGLKVEAVIVLGPLLALQAAVALGLAWAIWRNYER